MKSNIKSNISNLKKRLKLTLLFVPLLLLCSCGKQKLLITSNSFADVQAIPNGFSKESSFFVEPMKTDNQLFSKEVSRKIEIILQEKGYSIETAENADFYITFNFDMQSKTEIINVPRYIPGQTITKQGSAYGSTSGRIGSLHGSSHGNANYEEKTQSSGSITYVPQQFTYFIKAISIQVFDAKLYRENKQEIQVWAESSVCSGGNCDLRSAIDYLLLTAFKYFGKNTREFVTTTQNYNDKEVELLRKTYFPQYEEEKSVIRKKANGSNGFKPSKTQA